MHNQSLKFNLHDYRNCFRKQFTKSIYTKLKDGESINLIGNKGTGRQRLLEDLKLLAEQEKLSPIVVNLSGWKHDYQGLVRYIREQLKEHSDTITNSAETTSNSSNHLAAMLVNQLISHEHIFLLINNYDAILDNPKQQFPKSFFDDLNSLRNKSNLSLCLVTEYSHLQSQIFYKLDDGQTLKNSLSWLDLDIVEMPRPTLEEIRDELGRRFGNQFLWQKEQEKERYVQAIQYHQASYTFLEVIFTSFSTEFKQMASEKRLKLCYNQFKIHYNRKVRKKQTPWDKLRNLADWLIEKYATIKGTK